jgi:hypothetical protein
VEERPPELLREVRGRVSSDRDVVELVRLQPGVLEAPRRGPRREAGAVLHTVEALLLGGAHELAVEHERGCGVAVEGVQAQDRGHGEKLRAVRLAAR